MRKVLMFVVALCMSNGLNGQPPSYEVVESNSGISKIYSLDSLNSIADSIKLCVPNFEILGCDFYPTLLYASGEFQISAYENNFELAVTEMNNTRDAYIMITKEFYKDESIKYRVAIKFPSTQEFSSISILEKEAIISLVEQAIIDKSGSILSNAVNSTKIEIAGLKRFNEIINSICGGNFTLPCSQVLELSGFRTVNLPDSSTYTFESLGCDVNTENDIYDYACIEVQELVGLNNTVTASKRITSSFRENALVEMNMFKNVKSVSAALFLTSCDMPNYDDRMNLASTKFDETNRDISLWLHFESGTNGNKLFYRIKSDMNKERAKELIDKWYEESMNNYDNIEDFSANNQQSKMQDDGTYDCNKYTCSLSSPLSTCRAYCEWVIVDNPPFWVNESNPLETFAFGVGAGVLDGTLDTLEFVKLIIGGAAKAYQQKPSISDYLGELIVIAWKEGTAMAAWDIVEDDVIELYNSTTKFLSEGYELFKQLPSMIWSEIVKFMIDLDPRTGSMRSGFAVGKVVFDIILTYITGGSYSVLSKAKNFGNLTKRGIQQLKNFDPSTLVAKTRAALLEAKGTAKMLRCKILYGGCFVKDTPVLMAHNPFKNVAPALAMATMPLVAPIQDVQVDDMVKAYQHEEMYLTASNDDDVYVLGWQDYDYLDITPETWQVGKFIIEKEDGSLVEIEANRPIEWFEERKLSGNGDEVWLEIEEMGVADNAVLREIKSTDVDTREFILNESGIVDRPVITTYKRIANEIFDYTFSNGQVISCTPNHPFYSSDRQAYIAIGDFSFGESVKTSSDQEIRFIGGKLREKGEHVYNFEVWREHNYYAGFDQGDNFVLVHNSCWKVYMDSFFPSWTKKADPDNNWVDFIVESKPGSLKERQQLSRLGAHEGERMTILTKDKTGQDFPGIDGISDSGRPISLKEITSTNLTKVKDRIEEMGVKAVNAKNTSIPQLVDIDGMITANNFTVAQIKNAIDEVRGSVSEMSIVKRIFIEGSDGSIWY